MVLEMGKHPSAWDLRNHYVQVAVLDYFCHENQKNTNLETIVPLWRQRDQWVYAMKLQERDDLEVVTAPLISLPALSVALYVSVDADKSPKLSLHGLHSICLAFFVQAKLQLMGSYLYLVGSAASVKGAALSIPSWAGMLQSVWTTSHQKVASGEIILNNLVAYQNCDIKDYLQTY